MTRKEIKFAALLFAAFVALASIDGMLGDDLEAERATAASVRDAERQATQEHWDAIKADRAETLAESAFRKSPT